MKIICEKQSTFYLMSNVRNGKDKFSGHFHFQSQILKNLSLKIQHINCIQVHLNDNIEGTDSVIKPQ